MAVTHAAPTAAATLGSASTSVQCFSNGNSSFGPLECSWESAPGGFTQLASASAQLSPIANATARAITPATAVLASGADATVLYRFQVTGGNPGDLVPILIDYDLSVSATPESTAVAKILLYTTAMGPVPALADVLTCDPQDCSATTVSDTFSVQAVSGSTLDSVTLYAMAQAPVTRASNESAMAFADPYIYIDPSFPNASLYSIVVSPGVANVPVPEPGVAGLLGAGLAAFGLARRPSARP